MDEQLYLRLVAFINNKIQELNSVAEKVHSASKSLEIAHEKLTERDLNTNNNVDVLSKYASKLIDIWSNRPLFSGKFWIGAIIVSLLNIGTYYYAKSTFEKIGQDDKIDRIETRVMEMSNDLKWAQSAEGKAAKELFETLKNKHNYDISKINNDEKKAFLTYIAKGFK